MKTKTAAAFCMPTPVNGGTLDIVSQSGQFASAVYEGKGDYKLIMNPVPGLTIKEQLIPVATGFRTGGFVDITTLAGFENGVGTIQVRALRYTQTSGGGLAEDLIDSGFYLHVDILNLPDE